jgi:invasion protein IalB
MVRQRQFTISTPDGIVLEVDIDTDLVEITVQGTSQIWSVVADQGTAARGFDIALILINRILGRA